MKKSGKLHIGMHFIFSAIAFLEINISVALALFAERMLIRYYPLNSYTATVITLIIVSTVVGTSFSYFVGFMYLRPINRLRTAMRKVADGDYSVKLDSKKHTNDVGQLFGDFNKMVSELKSTEILKTDFVSNVSHEIKTPVSAIEGYATLLQDSTQDEESKKLYLDAILFNTSRLSELVSNILLLSRVENRSIKPQKHTYRLDEQIRQSFLLLEPKWAERDIEFDIELDDIEYCGHESMLMHVWNNLIDNAIKFTPDGGRIGVRLCRIEEGIKFTVEDSGPGFDEESKKHIFDKFFQGDTSHKAEGNGLGLALVSRILDACGGSVNAENRPEGGAKFTVILSE